MNLKQLFKQIPSIQFYGSQEVDIKGISANSKGIGPGYLFVVKQGKKFDGAHFIPDAIEAGAVALLHRFYDPYLKHIAQIIHPAPESLEIVIANRFYRSPLNDLKVIGVTGTNGKTTVTYLLKHIFHPSGLIGTVVWMTGKKIYPSTHTTPDYLTLMRLFSEMVQEGTKRVVMEVSSHAIDQNRIQDIRFQMTIFTNLSQDHLDYHHTMQHYAETKAKLFESLPLSAFAIMNRDDPAFETMLKNCKANRLTYGIIQPADLMATEIDCCGNATEFNVCYQGMTERFKTTLIGRFNIYNILAATAAALVQGYSLVDIHKKIASFPGVPGRLEPVANSKGLSIFVDYCHTPDALEKILKTLQEVKRGRLITVYGCGGDRDALKRPVMGEIAERFSDIPILTTDNPRSEDPKEIAEQVLKGCRFPHKTIVELDRQQAIKKAIQLASSQDTILIAGKGHETTQIYACHAIYFDDREAVRMGCEA